VNKIKTQLHINEKLLRDIDRLAPKINILDNNERHMLFAGLHNNALVHFRSINLLIEHELYNSAFSLIRVLFENIIKAKYMYFILNNNLIKKMYNNQKVDKYFKSIGEMCQQLDQFYNVNFYSTIKSDTYIIMNDYTHTGMTAIARNFDSDTATIEPNFDQESILEVLRLIHILVQTTSIVYFEQIGLPQGEISEDELKEFIK